VVTKTCVILGKSRRNGADFVFKHCAVDHSLVHVSKFSQSRVAFIETNRSRSNAISVATSSSISCRSFLLHRGLKYKSSTTSNCFAWPPAATFTLCFVAQQAPQSARASSLAIDSLLTVSALSYVTTKSKSPRISSGLSLSFKLLQRPK
jgi:hypothetical protein